MKNILGAVGITLSNAVEYVVDKNRKAAQAVNDGAKRRSFYR